MSGVATGLDRLAAEVVGEFAAFGVTAFTTGRDAGTFSMHSDEPARAVAGRWDELRQLVAGCGASRLATSHQVHGADVIVHHPGWAGWLRGPNADGHVAMERGTALAVSIADCVPVFAAHPSGAVAALHSGWRGTAARIIEHGIDAMTHRGVPAGELRVHLGPAICGRCYEVSPEVYAQLTGRDPGRPTPIDLRAVIADHARAAGVRHITISDACTRCHNDRLFSHRCGDAGRQVAVIVGDR